MIYRITTKPNVTTVAELELLQKLYLTNQNERQIVFP